MPEEAGAAGNQGDEINRRLDRIEQKLAWENRWWQGGLIAALVFIGIAILIAGHHHRWRPSVPPWVAGWSAGRVPPPPPLGWGPPGGYGPYGWGPGPYGGGRPPTVPPAPEAPSR
jgi:hypothetical protein